VAAAAGAGFRCESSAFGVNRWLRECSLGADSRPLVPVEIVECHPVTKGSVCTGVWRPTGEPEKTVTVHGDVDPHETVNARIHGAEAWPEGHAISFYAVLLIGLGVLCLGMVVVLVRMGRKSAP
jgi:hypothetical protein